MSINAAPVIDEICDLRTSVCLKAIVGDCDEMDSNVFVHDKHLIGQLDLSI